MEIELDRPNLSERNAKLLWCPFGEFSKTKMNTVGQYVDGSPRGCVVHFTAGRSLKGDSDSENCIAYGKTKGYAYWCLSRDGSILMSHDLKNYGYHAGTSEWKGKKSVSRYTLGLEINCAGRLVKRDGKFYSWFGEEIPESEVRYSLTKENIQEGYYHKYTKEQEASLVNLILWLKYNNESVFDFDWVVGHDECCVPAKRKNDPGASLSMPMPEFREFIKREWKVRYETTIG